MSIYTKTGDRGTTSLASGERVSKTDARLEAYGTADELNSFVGLLRSKVPATETTEQEHLHQVQNRLFNLGALLSDAAGEWIGEKDIADCEQWIDAIQAELEPLRAFILPGGSELISLCHVCRTITRRLERRMLEIDYPNEETQNHLRPALIWVNRLSDFFFVLSRKMAKNEKIEHFTWQK